MQFEYFEQRPLLLASKKIMVREKKAKYNRK
jgi:hypothetical protein